MKATYKLNRYRLSEKYHQYRVVLPNALCDQVWDAGIRSFTIEVTDAGILLKPGNARRHRHPASLAQAVKALADLAAAADIPYCRGIVNGSYCHPIEGHRQGFVRDGAVHFNRERLMRSSLRRFCLLAADLELGEIAGHPWEVRYQRSVTAERIARRMRVRLPSALWNVDRWTVRAQIARVPRDHPLRAEAMAWAKLAPWRTS